MYFFSLIKSRTSLKIKIYLKPEHFSEKEKSVKILNVNFALNNEHKKKIHKIKNFFV